MPTTWGRAPLKLARVGLVVLASYLLTACVVLPEETMFGLAWLPAWPILAATAVVLVACDLHPTNHMAQAAAIALAATFGGRATTLLFVGAGDLTRAREIAGVAASAAFLVLGLVAVIVVSVGYLTRVAAEGDDRWNG